ncbi:MAG: hypothetical protein RI842_11105, partial [Schleiferiaceae bacterium]|nr:hypothetical protein [Schleiferiaceae bacterium]
RIVTVFLLGLMVLTSCKPGANRPPVKSGVDVWDPYYNTEPVGPNGTITGYVIESRVIYTVLTTDDQRNTVKYPGGSSFNDVLPRQLASQRNHKITKDLDKPKGAAYFLVDVIVKTEECGWPLPKYNVGAGANTGGESLLRAFGDVLEYPDREVFRLEDFSLAYGNDC